MFTTPTAFLNFSTAFRNFFRINAYPFVCMGQMLSHKALWCAAAHVVVSLTTLFCSVALYEEHRSAFSKALKEAPLQTLSMLLRLVTVVSLEVNGSGW